VRREIGVKTDSIVDVPGIRVGHQTDLIAATGCTVVLCDLAMVGGCMVAGGSPGTRETPLLDPSCLVREVHAVLLGGGSAFGLNAAAGVVRYLEEQGRGLDMRVARVPIVPAAILFDLGLGDPTVRPEAGDGYTASVRASRSECPQGTVGVGTGATVGKLMGMRLATKGGLGSASLRLPGGSIVGALVAVNCAGDVIDPETGATVAGTRQPGGRGFIGRDGWMQRRGRTDALSGGNTTIAVVATDARLDKAQATRLAWLAYQGLARTISPITPFDGDTIFSLAALDWGRKEDLAVLGAAASRVMESAILRGVRSATGLHGCPAASEVDL
jgi:L-aminopeptidase/D-esterase-like protein